MSSLMTEMNSKAIELGIPLGVHLDITYRCNERCVHCYLDHDDQGEMTYDRDRELLAQMADAGVFFLTLSGGEPLMRSDCFEIIARAGADIQRQAEDERGADSGKECGRLRAGRRTGADQHLFAQARRCTTRSPSCRVRSSARSRESVSCSRRG